MDKKKKSHKDSKLAVLKDMSKEMKSMMSPKERKASKDSMSEMMGSPEESKKVTVAAADDESLMEGLSAAQKMLKKMKKS